MNGTPNAAHELTRPDVDDSPAASGTSTPAAPAVLPPKPAGKSKWQDEDVEDEEEVSAQA